MKIMNDKAFSVPTSSFAISPSSYDYVLNFSVDGKNFTQYTSYTYAGENLLVTGSVPNLIYKLVGNEDTVLLQY